jgi:hypothetical protein
MQVIVVPTEQRDDHAVEQRQRGILRDQKAVDNFARRTEFSPDFTATCG